ncbi:MAG: hypothetical protein H6713_00730 [Myxococcales bacterium]|nr:hypothetical protein [Myxococcales bacterium]
MGARRAWSRARVALDERGARARLVPVEKWFVARAFWVGDQLALVRHWRPVAYSEPLTGEELQLWSPARADAPVRNFIFPTTASTWGVSHDDRWLLRVGDGALHLHDVVTGRARARVPYEGGRALALATAGAGDELVALIGAEEGTELRRVDGSLLARYTLEGTTPTITRVYTGEGTHHNNILNDTPSWPVAVALSADARWVAIGGSDSKVRLFDRARGDRRRVLEIPWRYEERRHGGANADRNPPLDMRFRGGGDELVVAFGRGDIVTWRTRDGRELQHVPGDCSRAEARREQTRYGPQPDAAPPTPEQRAGCGRAHLGALSRDVGLLATYGGGTRVRTAGAGQPLALEFENEFVVSYLAFSPGGTLAIADIYGRVELWTRERGRAGLLRAGPTGPSSPRLSDDGRALQFSEYGFGRAPVTWDLLERRELRPALGEGERIVARAGERYVVRSGDALEHRADGCPPVTLRAVRPEQEASAWLASEGEVVALDVREYQQPHELSVHAPASRRAVALPAAPNTRIVGLSADGRRVAGIEDDARLRVWDAESGASLLTTEAPRVRATELARDGSLVAWIEDVTPRRAEVTARAIALDGSALPIASITARGWSNGLTLSPRGDELLIYTEQALTRWNVRTGEHGELPREGRVYARRVHYSRGGELLMFEHFGRVELYRDAPTLPPVGALYSLIRGDWYFENAAGAVTGSEAAPESLMTLAEGADGLEVYDGRLLWDRRERPDAYRRALAGEQLTPYVELGEDAPAPADAPAR